MTKITAIIRSDKLKAVESALREAGAPGFTYYNVRGHGREILEKVVGGGGPPEMDFYATIQIDVLPRVKFEVICSDEASANIVKAIREASSTGVRGDGIIYTSEVDNVTRILSGEVGEKALAH